jgi:hypothetical protein
MPSIRSLYRVGHKSCFLISTTTAFGSPTPKILPRNVQIPDVSALTSSIDCLSITSLFDNLPQISNANGPGFYLNTVTLILASQMAIH